jgi:transposase
MIKKRVVKTGSSGKAVQAVIYLNNRRTILKHFGSCHSADELKNLLKIADEWIIDYSKQLFIFPENPNSVLHLDRCSFLGVYHTFFHEIIVALINQIGFSDLKHPLLNDLVIIRIFEPASKLRSIELLETYFGIKHRRQNFYKLAPKWLKLKDIVAEKVVAFAEQNYGFNYDLLFYDVTTLYFETFDDDDLRKQGFSKDNKSQQPQILVALLVTKEGFPIAYDIFSGNTFEGNTIIPSVKSFIEKHKVKHFTVIADAAMISSDNVSALKENNVHYIVGARLGNLSDELINKIDNQVPREDGKSIRIKTPNGDLICSYSSTRYRKDKYEMDKQIEKAKLVVEKPSKDKKTKFTKKDDQKIKINQVLIDKTTKLLGIKGYYTDIEEITASNSLIIDRYHELYKIEQAFRISKSDLETRPIFHFKEEPIKLHMLICFMALVISKQIELKTGVSIKRFITDCKKVTDARMLNQITNKEVRIRTAIEPKILGFLSKLNIPH